MQHWMTPPYHWLWALFWLAIWVLVIIGIVKLIGTFLGKNKIIEKRAMDILDERYARGEITKEEYLEKKKDISGA